MNKIPKHYIEITPLNKKVCSDGSCGWVPILPIINYCNNNLKPFDLNINLINLEGINLNCDSNLYNIIIYLKGMENINLDYPIIMSSCGLIVDGTHRIVKAILDDIDIIKCFKLPNTINELINEGKIDLNE